MRLIGVLILTTLILFPISLQSQSGFTIKGKVKNGEGLVVYLDYASSKIVPSDEAFLYESTIVTDGSFDFTGSVKAPRYYRISIEGKKGWKSFILENVDYTIEVSVDSIWTSVIEGTKEIYINKEYKRLTNPLIQKKNEALDSALATSDDSIKEDYNSLANIYDQQIKLQTKSIIEKYPDSYTSLFLFNNLDSFLTHDKRKELFTSFSERIREHPLAKRIYYQLYELDNNIAIGKKLPPSVLKDKEGYTVKLEDFEGRFLIIDFWATWSPTWIGSKTDLKTLFAKYNIHGLEILSVGIGKDFDRWKKNVEANNYAWLNVLDLDQGGNNTVFAYNITRVPTYFLLDRDGKLIGIFKDIYSLSNAVEALFN